LISGCASDFSNLAVRWTIGNVRDRGFELLRLSIACAYNLFGPRAAYVVCVNSISAQEACVRTGILPIEVEWRQTTLDDLPDWLRPHLDENFAEGTGWKLAPFRLCPERYVLALDNDCILWKLPEAIERWLQSPGGVLIAEDVQRYLGRFDYLCPPGAFNSGIRGLAPAADFEAALRSVLHEAASSCNGPCIASEVDEQGLQVAAIFRMQPAFLVKKTEVSICSPFWPRSLEFGSCGAHFVGMNTATLPWNYFDRPAEEWLDEHWNRHRPALYSIAGSQAA
jgi:hypothetical protein